MCVYGCVGLPCLSLPLLQCKASQHPQSQWFQLPSCNAKNPIVTPTAMLFAIAPAGEGPGAPTASKMQRVRTVLQEPNVMAFKTAMNIPRSEFDGPHRAKVEESNHGVVADACCNCIWVVVLQANMVPWWTGCKLYINFENVGSYRCSAQQVYCPKKIFHYTLED